LQFIVAEFFLQLINAAFMTIMLIYMAKVGYKDFESASFVSYRFLGVLLFAFPLGLIIKGRKLKPIFYASSILTPTIAFVILEAIDQQIDWLLYLSLFLWGISFTGIQISALPYILRNAKKETHTEAITLSYSTWSVAGIVSGTIIFGLKNINPQLFDEKLSLNHIHVDASEKFLSALEDVTDPEEKRKLIGKTFIEVFEEEAKKIENAKFLIQGTLYPDVIESVSVKGASATIKTHHNVGGLPDNMHLKLIEPFRELFKDEVRKIGKELEINEELIQRHPFPGPGLAVRVLGEITKPRLDILREADDIFISAIREAGLYNKIWQAFAVLLPVSTVGVMGDSRTYEYVLSLRAVTSQDGMTADWFSFEHDFLADVSNKIINRVRGINRVVYDISSKPPATIEWE